MSVILLRGDARQLPLPDESVDLIVCSPPYYGQRDYLDGGESLAGQIGAEGTPQEYVAALLACTREWARVLKPGGSLFVNLGDRYSARTGAGPNAALGGVNVRPMPNSGIAPKCLMGLPWRYAIGCCDDLGLILRAEIIWSKANGMPESASDRARRSHEQLFHFTRQPTYYSAVDEVREPHAAWTAKAYEYERTGYQRRANADRKDHGGFAKPPEINPLGKLPGSVWEITSQPLFVPGHLDVDHFAAFPMELPRRCILGWSPSAICTACGEGRFPVIDARRTLNGEPVTGSWQTEKRRGAAGPQGTGHWRYATARTHLGDACPCTPFTDHPERRGKDFHAGTDRAAQGMNDRNGGERYRLYVEELENPRGPVREYHFDEWVPAPTRPAVVLDPFSGTGTTALVASMLGRVGVGVDRSADYCRLARWRTTDPAERARALQVPKPPPVIDGQESLFEVGA